MKNLKILRGRIRKRIEDRITNFVVGSDFAKEKVKVQVELPRLQLPRIFGILPELPILPKVTIENEYERKEKRKEPILIKFAN